MNNFLTTLPRPFLVLAPMDDVTDTVFRQVVGSCAPPDVFFTEFVNVEALQSKGRESTLKRLRYEKSEHPLIAQIWGKNSENFYKTAQELVGMGFDGVDLNMGCPDKSVVRNGCGGGLTKNPEHAVDIIQATKEGLGGELPLSVKTRIGFSSYDEDWLRILLEQKLNMLSIHFRTVREMSKFPAQWNLATDVRQLRDTLSPDTLLVGNGDVLSSTQAHELAQKYGLDGVMIGRGVFHDPYVFANQSPWLGMSALERVGLFERHVALFEKTWLHGEKPIAPLNKFCKIYINHFEGAKEYREKLMSSRDIDQLKTSIQDVKHQLWSR